MLRSIQTLIKYLDVIALRGGTPKQIEAVRDSIVALDDALWALFSTQKGKGMHFEALSRAVAVLSTGRTDRAQLAKGELTRFARQMTTGVTAAWDLRTVKITEGMARKR